MNFKKYLRRGNIMGILRKEKFKNINLNDVFFNSLKEDYKGFEDWFNKKSEEESYIIYDKSSIQGFLYLKKEEGIISDVSPIINCKVALKIGTFKIIPHGTRLGERFIKKSLDYALSIDAELCYVTIFSKQVALIDLFKKYGFIVYGTKNTPTGDEIVLVKRLDVLNNNILLDYPLINLSGSKKYLLSIYPQYHSVMFPDSILRSENVNILEDVTITNSIHKTYVTRMRVNSVKPGDLLVMYRTKTQGHSAEYTAVATSICVVEEVKHQKEFIDFNAFYEYATTYSIFDKYDLQDWYNKGGCYAMKMTYNAALSKKLIRKKLIEELNMERDIYWGFFELTDNQFKDIIREGGVFESIVVD
jgi:hypothetical protein